ncbi:DoxX family membrane protein [Terriglobus roseus]|uniref:DoxX family membrane protein n=1 Tax=Terriglobus roseus TaxID=392734 RepID=UPI0006945607|nr:DoxX family membrane protein [Terriglobus roseus]
MAFRFVALFWVGFLLRSGVLLAITAFAPLLQHWLLPWPVRILTWPVQALTSLLAHHVFHLAGVAAVAHQTGSGDTALAWIGMLALVLVSWLGCVVWTTVASVRGVRQEYRTLFAYLHLALRISLAATLLGYGFSKVFDAQFSPPGLNTLNERLGDFSPMGLLWTFMGYSIPYTVLSGVAEVIPGILLLFRRTATLGALISVAVFLNVVALNFCYDVPVKLFSSTLLVLSMFLLLPDMGRLWSVFIQHRAVPLRTPTVPKPERHRLRIAGYVLQALVIASLFYTTISNNYHAWWTDPVPQQKHLLTQRGFHWVQENPFNR